MIKARSKVKINKTMVKKLDKAAITALEKTAEALHMEIVNAQVMPFDTGNMQGKNTFIQAGSSVEYKYENGDSAVNEITKCVDGKVSIITQGPQARRLYYHPEYNYQKTNNPKAGGQWLEPWISGSEKDFAQKAFKEHYKRLGGV